MQILNSDTPRDHLILPDSHTGPKDNLRRYEAVGNYIVAQQPPVIVQLGDFADMGSLSSYDVGKKEFVFQNVQDDIESFHTAEEVMFAPLHHFNKGQTKLKKAQYNPIYVKLIGNHEYRLKKLLDYEPRWQSKTICMDAFKTRQPINEVVVDFMDWIEIDGVSYTHYWASGVLGRPVSGAKAILAKKGVSGTMGHTHTLDSASLTKPDGTRIRGLVAGCLLDPEYKGFAGPQVDKLYWSGLIHKHGVHKGDYDLSELSIERLLKEYS